MIAVCLHAKKPIAINRRTIPFFHCIFPFQSCTANITPAIKENDCSARISLLMKNRIIPVKVRKKGSIPFQKTPSMDNPKHKIPYHQIIQIPSKRMGRLNKQDVQQMQSRGENLNKHIRQPNSHQSLCPIMLKPILFI